MRAAIAANAVRTLSVRSVRGSRPRGGWPADFGESAFGGGTLPAGRRLLCRSKNVLVDVVHGHSARSCHTCSFASGGNVRTEKEIVWLQKCVVDFRGYWFVRLFVCCLFVLQWWRRRCRWVECRVVFETGNLKVFCGVALCELLFRLFRGRSVSSPTCRGVSANFMRTTT